MHSVRVKRGQYASLQDGPQERITRPRSRSLATIFGSPTLPSTSVVPVLPQEQGHVRQRSQTLSVPGGDPTRSTVSPPRTLRRPSSKIHDHIMSSTRGGSTRRYLQPEGGPDSPLLGRRRDDEGSDIVSLQGSAGNVEYRGDARRMGRIGSALSLPSDEYDDAHHEDDIVEHLDVIGKCDVLPSRRCPTDRPLYHRSCNCDGFYTDKCSKRHCVVRIYITSFVFRIP